MLSLSKIGVQPQRGDTQIFEIRQVVLNALEVPTVIGLGSLPVVRARCRPFRHVVAGIAVGKTVGHDQVDHIVESDALESILR